TRRPGDGSEGRARPSRENGGGDVRGHGWPTRMLAATCSPGASAGTRRGVPGEGTPSGGGARAAKRSSERRGRSRIIRGPRPRLRGRPLSFQGQGERLGGARAPTHAPGTAEISRTRLDSTPPPNEYRARSTMMRLARWRPGAVPKLNERCVSSHGSWV